MGSELSICKKCRKTRWLAVINTCSHCVSTAIRVCHGQGHDQRSFDGREGLDDVTDRTSRPSKPRDGCHPMTPKRRGDGSLGLCDQDPLDAGLPHKKDRSSSPRVLEKSRNIGSAERASFPTVSPSIWKRSLASCKTPWWAWTRLRVETISVTHPLLMTLHIERS